LELAPNQLV